MSRSPTNRSLPLPLKCFMCGERLPTEEDLDRHVILCAKGNATRTETAPAPVRLSSSTVAPGAGDSDGPSCSTGNMAAVVSEVSNPFSMAIARSGGPQQLDPNSVNSAVPAADDKPPSPIPQTHSISREDYLDVSADCGSSCSTPPPEDVFPRAGEDDPLLTPDGESSPQNTPAKLLRRKKAALVDGDSSERRQRRNKLEEAMQSLEEMQQANQERLRAVYLQQQLQDAATEAEAAAALSNSKRLVTFARHNSCGRHPSVTPNDSHQRSLSPTQRTLNDATTSSAQLDTSTSSSPPGGLSRGNSSRKATGAVFATPAATRSSSLRQAASLERTGSAAMIASPPSGASKSSTYVDPYANSSQPATTGQIHHSPLGAKGSSVRESPATSRVSRATSVGGGGGVVRAVSTEARRATESPKLKRSSTVAARRASAAVGSTSSFNATAVLSSTAGGASSPEAVDANRPLSATVSLSAAPSSHSSTGGVRASTTVRQRWIGSAGGTGGGAVAAVSSMGARISALLPASYIAQSPKQYQSGHVKQTLPNAVTRVARGHPATPGPSASTSQGAPSRLVGTALSSSAMASTTAVPAQRKAMTISTGHISIGGVVPPPRHDTLRAPNQRKMPTDRKPTAPSGGAQAVLTPPPNLSTRQHMPLTTKDAEEVAVFCADCGKRYVDKAKFCAFCGHRREVLPI